MTTSRRPLQGLLTILRFNWHFFAGAAAALAAFVLAGLYLSRPFGSVSLALSGFGALAVILSLVASFIAYDATGLYRFDWLDRWMRPDGTAANIHAGFDETSAPLLARYPRVIWQIADFYDPVRHTEISIRRARAAHPPHPGTVSISSTRLPFADEAFDRILLLLAAHEIRDHAERVVFFRELRRALRPAGLILVTEHLRDPANLLVYNLGAWHFHTPREWLATIAEAGLRVETRLRLNPFITLFVLRAS